MFKLIFRILADATGFNRTLKTDLPVVAKESGNKAGKAAGDEMSKVMGAQLKAGIMRYLGAGALLSVATKAVMDAATMMADAVKLGLDPEAYQELTKAIAMTGLTMDELRKKAVETPEAFAKLMETVRAQGGILPKETIEQLVQAKVAMDELREATSKATGYIATKLLQAWYGMQAGFGAALETAGGIGSYGVGTDNPLSRWGQMYSNTARNAAERMNGIPQLESGAPGPAFLEASKREQAAKDKLKSDYRTSLLTGMNQTLGFGSSSVSGAIGSLPFMNQVVAELKKANDKLQTLNTTTKNQ